MIGAAAPVCAVSAERTMVPKRGPRISVWGAHERAVSSAIEDRITRTQSLDCVSRLRAAVSRVNERDGYTTTSRIYGAFRDAGFLTLTPRDVEDDLCKGVRRMSTTPQKAPEPRAPFRHFSYRDADERPPAWQRKSAF